MKGGTLIHLACGINDGLWDKCGGRWSGEARCPPPLCGGQSALVQSATAFAGIGNPDRIHSHTRCCALRPGFATRRAFQALRYRASPSIGRVPQRHVRATTWATVDVAPDRIPNRPISSALGASNSVVAFFLLPKRLVQRSPGALERRRITRPSVIECQMDG